MGVGFPQEMRGKGARSWEMGEEKIPLSLGRGISAGNGEGNKLKDVSLSTLDYERCLRDFPLLSLT